MQKLETCNTVQISTEYVHKRNRTLIQVTFAELCLLEQHTYLDHITLSPQLLQYLMQRFETYYTVQTCTGQVHEGNGILIQVSIAESCSLKQNLFTVRTCIGHMHERNGIFIQVSLQNYVPLMTYFFTFCHCSRDLVYQSILI